MKQETLISKSGKDRQGHSYRTDSWGLPVTVLDKTPRAWKQVIVKVDAGYKKVNGQPALMSRTFHIPA